MVFVKILFFYHHVYRVHYNNNYCSTTDKRNCLQSDGSGYFIVPNGAHGFFYNHGFILKDTFLENDPSLQWGIKMNFDWLSKTSKLFAVVISNDDNTNINKNQDEIKKTPAEECTESKDMPKKLQIQHQDRRQKYTLSQHKYPP